jgi:glycosyltransferase involved in cell wall biosynthesis
VLIIDAERGEIDGAAEPFDALIPADVGIEDFERMAGIYDVKELSTAVKPALLEHLLESNEVVTYLDPDIEVHASLEEVERLALDHGVVLTPHTTTPVPADGRQPDQDFILRAGAYNLGFIAVSRRPEVSEMLTWWRRRLLRESIDDVARDRFVDQRWIDLLPGFVSDLAVLRGPGYNVAYWNLFERALSRSGDEILVNGEPLRFFHYSGYSPGRADELSRHQDRIDLGHEPLLRELLDGYRGQLRDHGYEKAAKTPYGLGRLPNGLELTRGLRQRYRLALDAGEIEGSIFTPEGANAFIELLETDVGEWGVNAIGYFNAEMGVGEAGRQMVAALAAADIPRAVVPLESINRQDHAFAADRMADARYPVNLICANADAVGGIASELAQIMHGRYSIGLWWWEVEEFPRRWMSAFSYLDQVWAGTEHVERAIAAVSPIPVRRVRIPVAPVEPSGAGRAELGLPDGFLFLFTFDYLSDFERKNPLGVIEAFSRAFEPGSGVRLIVKSINAKLDPDSAAILEQAAAEHPDVTVADGYLDNSDKNAMIATSDCYVSLHRSEGFGLGLAEAMFFGVPAIATRYSGNLEFMDDANSFLVDYATTEASERSVYSGAWAEPDLDGAAVIMRRVFEEPELARERARRGQETIREKHSAEAAGEVLASRLEDLRPDALRRIAGAGEDGVGTALARSAVLAGPPKPARTKLGPIGSGARRLVLRLIKPFTAHQRRADLLTIDAVEQLRAEIDTLNGQLSALQERVGERGES